MKLLKIFMILFVLGGFAICQITGSSHDLSTSGPAAQASTDQDRICVFCHTPHNGSSDVLWNRTNPAAGTFTNHAEGAALSEGSLKCLSCHDGATAVNSLTDGTTATFAVGAIIGAGAVLVGDGDFGLDLTDDHPVGMDYVDDDTPGFHNASTLGDGDEAKLVDGKVACASCHDPHDLTFGAFMIGSNAGSAICLDCHDK